MDAAKVAQADREYRELQTEAGRAMEWGIVQAAIRQAEEAAKR